VLVGELLKNDSSDVLKKSKILFNGFLDDPRAKKRKSDDEKLAKLEMSSISVGVMQSFLAPYCCCRQFESIAV